MQYFFKKILYNFIRKSKIPAKWYVAPDVQRQRTEAACKEEGMSGIGI